MNEVERLKRMALSAKMGWCELSPSLDVFLLSPYLIDLLGASENKISLTQFIDKIRKDYQEQLSQVFAGLIDRHSINVRFPVHTPAGDIWLYLHLENEGEKSGEGKSVSGFMQQIEPIEEMDSAVQILERVNNLLYQQNAISRSLLDFLRNEKVDNVIHRTLSDILKQFRGGRVYIFEYDFEKRIQRNTYEVVSRDVAPQIQFLQDLSMNITPWWNRQMQEQKPIILDTMEDFPSEVGEEERQILIGQEINSLMVLPLTSGEQTWGYIGIDVVVGFRSWSPEDYQWFASLANIISICIELHKAKDHALHEQRFLYNLYSYMPLGYLRIKLTNDDISGVMGCRLIGVNDLGCKFIGKPLHDFMGRHIGRLELGGVFDLSVFAKVSRENVHHETDVYFAESGRNCHCILYSPEPQEVVMLLVDMTAMHEANRASVQSRRMFKDIFDNSPVGIEIYDREGALLDLNNKDLEIFGVKREDAIGINFFANPNVPPSIKEKVHRKEMVDFRLKYSFDDVEGENYYATNRKGVIDLYSKITPMYDPQGNVIQYLLINIDNTEQCDAINRIRDFEYFFLLISDYAQLGYAKVNLISREGYAVQQWMKNLGEDIHCELRDIVCCYHHVHPDDRKALLQFHQEAIAGESNHFKAEIRVKDSQATDWHWLQVNSMVTVFKPENQEVEIVEVNFDITEQKKVEAKLIEARDKAETMDRLKSAFLANMSHEIRTPLNAIVGFSGLLCETEEMAERQQYISIIQKNNECLLQLVSDILDLAKIEADTYEVHHMEVNIRQLCKEIYNQFADKVNGEVKLFFDEDLPEIYLVSDPDRIRQVLSNFVTNAVKFTLKGHIRIGYEMQEGSLLIYVEDTGLGIAADKLPYIFERFVKLNSFIQGTGLGLSICQSIIHRLQGKIGVESEEEKGSRFWISLPYDCSPHG